METINKEVSDSLHFLLHCSLKDTEFETQREQFREVYFYIEKLENNWNELKKWLESNHKYSEFAVWEILKQMQELENRKV